MLNFRNLLHLVTAGLFTAVPEPRHNEQATDYKAPRTLDDFEARASKEKKRRTRLAEIAGLFRSVPIMYPHGVKLHYVHAGHRHRARVVNRAQRRAIAARVDRTMLAALMVTV